MNSKKSIKVNFIMNVLLTASSIIFPLITFPYISRILLPAGTGKVAFATSIISYFSMLSALGIPTYGIRACAGVRDDKNKLSKIVHEIFLINLITTILTYILFFICLVLIPQLQQNKNLYIICSSTLLFNLIGMEWLYKALEEYSYITTRSIVFKIAALFLMFLLVHTESDYLIYGAITILAGVGSNIINFINIRKYINISYCGPYNYRHHLKPIFTFFALSVSATIYTNLDIVMLGFIKGELAVGYYNSAVKIKVILVAFVTSLSAVLLPRSSYYVEKKLTNKLFELASRSIQFVTLTSFPLIIYFTITAKDSILFLSGPAFYGSIRPMQFILPTILFIGLTNVMGIQLLVPLGKEKLVLYSTIAGALLDTLINFLLIPDLGAEGAAIGTLAAEFAVLILQIVFLQSNIKILFKGLQPIKLIMSLLLSTMLLILFNINTGIILIDLVITSLIFFGTYLISLKFILHYNFNASNDF